jgi:hypothetical protein
VLGACKCRTGLDICPGKFSWSDSICVNTGTDEENCGACGNVCPSGSRCSRGRCSSR